MGRSETRAPLALIPISWSGLALVKLRGACRSPCSCINMRDTVDFYTCKKISLCMHASLYNPSRMPAAAEARPSKKQLLAHLI